ncbi:hypothetical protein BKE38_07375 [Pseudoroseomonas deserti]|uniref:DUF2491 domain-containing protein n=1 Tax=Teichococcus deserti TaxID=1817963 RepID=A0A1V2H5Y9_9PROT|nr:DUF2491 family protein [Pseudoroseomonas deserti]ONG55974.1 hypothetical protein BKE38_07375 [Pseudoroseomonas deserti]
MRKRLAVPLIIAGLAIAGQAGIPPASYLAPRQLIAEAEARPRSSGGYSRSPSTSRSYSSGSSSRSSSGGYARPSSGSSRTPSTSPSYRDRSAGDRSYSRSQSGDALRRLRERDAAEQRRRDTPATTSGSTAGSGGGWWGSGSSRSTGRSSSGGSYSGGYSSGGGYAPGGYGGWYRDRGWAPPAGMLGGPRRFGIWDAAFLWFLFSTLSSPGHADFFHHHQADPGYQQFRQTAEQRAASDPEIRSRLTELDTALDSRRDQPRNADFLPPDVPLAVATGQEALDARTPSTADAGEEEEGGIGAVTVILVLLAGGAVLAVLAWRRRRPEPPTMSSGPSGNASPLQSAGNILRHKMSGEAYAPSQFRLGMPVSIDPTPFILAAGATHLAPPPSGAGALSVEAIGRIGGTGQGSIVRLYLPEEQGMIQLHLGAGNAPDECRFFALLDEVTPADEAEWEAWLDPREGMIGWPEFQTKDGQVYQRIWAPGAAKVAPRDMPEEVETTQGRRSIRNQSMLYGRPTGSPAPAPATEYILVSAIEDGQDAWVEIRAGLDLNPASLSLA